LAVFILIAGVLSILWTPKDIFPSINIRVISVIWTYTGMSPSDVADHLTTPYERVLTTTVDNIEHIESQSLYGLSVVNLSAAERECAERYCAGHLGFASRTETATDGGYPAVGAQLQCHQRANTDGRFERFIGATIE
jgi:hypothetical protein